MKVFAISLLPLLSLALLVAADNFGSSGKKTKGKPEERIYRTGGMDISCRDANFTLAWDGHKTTLCSEQPWTLLHAASWDDSPANVPANVQCDRSGPPHCEIVREPRCEELAKIDQVNNKPAPRCVLSARAVSAVSQWRDNKECYDVDAKADSFVTYKEIEKVFDASGGPAWLLAMNVGKNKACLVNPEIGKRPVRF